MFDQHFLSSAAPADVFGPLQGGERMMWRGRCGVAEYAFDEAASLPRWTLPESTDVLVTDHRVLYAYIAEDGHQVKSGELRWLWPQHLRVQPGARSTDRGAAATQIQMVCGGADGTYPALVFAGGDLATVGDADRLANVIRQAIARFRVDNADKLGLTAGQARMLSRLLIGPEFRNHQGGEGQTVSLLGALLVNRPAPALALPASVPSVAPVSAPSAPTPIEVFAVSADAVTVEEFVMPARSSLAAATAARTTEAVPTEAVAQPIAEGTRLINYRPGRAADAARALMAAKAEQATQQAEPALASRAADLASRVANLIARSAAEPEPETVVVPEEGSGTPRFAPEREAPTVFRPEPEAETVFLPERDALTVFRPEREAETVFVPEFERVVPPVGSDDGATWEVHRSAWRAEAAHRDSTWASERRPRHSEPRVADAWYADDLRMTRAEERGARMEQDRVGPGDGRPVARHGERRPGGPGERRMSRSEELRMGQAAETRKGEARKGEPRKGEARKSDAQRLEVPTANLAERAEAIRRSAARMASNAARGRIGWRRADRETGVSTRGNRDK
jgi:hypothetical protein